MNKPPNFRLPVDANRVFNCQTNKNKKRKERKESFVCLLAYRALTPCRDWTRPETDCLQHSKEKVDFFIFTLHT